MAVMVLDGFGQWGFLVCLVLVVLLFYYRSKLSDVCAVH